jgi:heme exporter protein B
MTIRTRARDLVLAAVLLPLLSPSLLAGVAGTRALFDGAPARELVDYLALMGLSGAIFVAGGLSMFAAVIED